MTAKKRLRSKRNRHTGRVNAAKGAVLIRGRRARTQEGRVYVASAVSQGGMIVRDFQEEYNL